MRVVSSSDAPCSALAGGRGSGASVRRSLGRHIPPAVVFPEMTSVKLTSNVIFCLQRAETCTQYPRRGLG